MDEIIDVTKSNNTCKGKIYKGRVSQYQTRDGILVFKTELYPLKKSSCPGCPFCGWIEDSIYMDGVESIVGMESVEDGELYTFAIKNVCVDYEMGRAYDWDFCVVPVNSERGQA